MGWGVNLEIMYGKQRLNQKMMEKMGGNVGEIIEKSQLHLIFPGLPKKKFLPIVAVLKNCSPPLTDGKLGKCHSPHPPKNR